MKTVGFMCLHYGLTFIEYAIQSVLYAVDEFVVVYSDIGSHGHITHLRCPESETDLHHAAERAAGNKLRWYGGRFANEGEHRAMIHKVAPDAEIILVVDSDEVYADGLAQEAVEFTARAGVRRVRLPFIHLWRAFNKGFAHDPAYPHRVYNMTVKDAESEATMPTDKRVWHFGYAQPARMVQYKLLTHGHKGEWRKDVDWFNDVFLANRQTDCHPVGSDAWSVEAIDLSGLPSVLQAHPLKDVKVIE